MYRHCIFCSAPLGANDVVEHFPVGRSLAFDAARGRLWAVCPRCARWNLAPIQERWEAIEAAERLFRDCRLRVQSENVGLARLRDGTRLVRVGGALPGELALWRYAGQLARRRRRALAATALAGGTAAAVVGIGLVQAAIGLGSVFYAGQWTLAAARRVRGRRAVHAVASGEGDGPEALIRRRHLDAARLGLDDATGELRLSIPDVETRTGQRRVEGLGQVERWEPRTHQVAGDEARRLLSRVIVHVNDFGGSRRMIGDSVRILERAGSPGGYVHTLARRGVVLRPESGDAAGMSTEGALALEMAVHEEQERRAMQGELAALEEMWRQAEAIAAIADRLPDALNEETR
ncbi:MAG TPA: hypothetical protein VFQ45_04685 [Longimicrobium sp.]|nr:hypothetical protein [Longimicrobium sp.]